jgi:Ser/Thr protein kinase RdoA (MazF antagonist)
VVGTLPRELPALRRSIDQSTEGEQQELCRELFQQIQRHAPAVTQELANWRDRPFFLQPCLRDIWHDHVLFVGDRVTGLIDPSACRTEHVAADLSRLIGSLVEDDAAGWQLALDFYQERRKLGLDELALVTVLDRSGVLLGARTWLDWLYGQGRTFEKRGEVLARLRYFHRRLQAFERGPDIW